MSWRDVVMQCVGGSQFRERVEADGLTFRALTGGADFGDDLLAAFPGRAETEPGPEQLNWDIAHVFGDSIPEQLQVLQLLPNEDPDQVLVSDMRFPGAWPSAMGVGHRALRWVSVNVSPLYAASADTTPFGPAPATEGQDHAAANRAANAAISQSFSPALDHIRSIVQDLGATDALTEYVSAIYRLLDVTAQPSVSECEFPRRDLPDTIRYVGNLAPTTPMAWSEPVCWDELPGERPVILVTQGTIANSDLGDLVEPTLEAPAGEAVLTIAALGRDRDSLTTKTSSNIRVEEYIPFADLFKDVDVFVTDGGHGATQQALAAGVPVVIAGTTEDKPAVAGRVAYHRVGIDLQTQRLSPEQVRGAVNAILSDAG